jgi:hypothetical protein
MSYPIIAYSLWQKLDRINELPPDPMDRKYGEAEDYDALIHKSEEQDGIGSDELTYTEPYDGPEPVDFVGFLERLPHQTDFLSTNSFEPIISKRMLYVLRSVGDFPHKTISTRIYDYGFQDQGRNNYDGSTTILTGEFNEDYVGLQLLEHVEGIDYEHTEFRPSQNPDILPPQISTLVLKEPEGGFPPIFRLAKRRTVYLFVSPAAKEALEEAGIKGLGFTEYEGTRAQEVSTAH